MEPNVKISFGNSLVTIACAVGIVLFMHFWQGKMPGVLPTQKDTIVVEHFVHDSSVRIIEQPKYYFIKDSVFIGIPNKVDTLAILKDYFTRYVGTYVFRDSLLEATVTDTILKNSSIGMGFTYKNLRPISVTTIMEKPKNKVFIGPFISYQQPQLSGGLSLSLENKQGRLLSFGYDPFHKGYYAAYAFKIHLVK
jgi:hypothetical protein